MIKSWIIRGDAIIFLPSTHRFMKKPTSKRSQDTVKFQKKPITTDSESFASHETPVSNCSDHYRGERRSMKIILPKNDKKIFDEFKNMLLSYDQGLLNRRCHADYRKAGERD